MSAEDMEALERAIKKYEKTHPKTNTAASEKTADIYTMTEPVKSSQAQAWARYGMGFALTDKDIKEIVRSGRYKSEYELIESIKYVNIIKGVPIYHLERNVKNVEGLSFRAFISDKAETTSKMLVVWAKYQPNPFNAVYKDFDELKDEMKDALARYLPTDFNWESHIGYISYTFRETALYE